MLILGHLSLAQTAPTGMGARNLGMASLSSVLSDESSLFYNIGAMASQRQTSIALAYEVTPLLEGANRTVAGLLFPAMTGTAGISFFRFGDEIYSEQMISGGFSSRMGIGSLGSRINVIQYRSDLSGVRTAWSVDFGGRAEIVPGLAVGAYGTNLGQPIFQNGETLPTKLIAGLSYQPTSGWLLATEVEKQMEYHSHWRIGMEHSIRSKIFLRAGFGLHPNEYSWGLGGIKKSLKADFAMRYNQAFGWTIQTSAFYQLSKERKR